MHEIDKYPYPSTPPAADYYLGKLVRTTGPVGFSGKVVQARTVHFNRFPLLTVLRDDQPPFTTEVDAAIVELITETP